MIKYLTLIFMIFLMFSQAAIAEAWQCKKGWQWYEGGDILVTASVNDVEATGTIIVSGIKHKTSYMVEGFNRRWDFDLSVDSTYNYAFIILPDGRGRYYNFKYSESGKEVSPSQRYICHRTLKVK